MTEGLFFDFTLHVGFFHALSLSFDHFFGIQVTIKAKLRQLISHFSHVITWEEFAHFSTKKSLHEKGDKSIQTRLVSP